MWNCWRNRKSKMEEIIQKRNQAYGKNRHLLKNQQLIRKTMMNVYRGMIRQAITYAMETNIINKKIR